MDISEKCCNYTMIISVIDFVCMGRAHSTSLATLANCSSQSGIVKVTIMVVVVVFVVRTNALQIERLDRARL